MSQHVEEDTLVGIELAGRKIKIGDDYQTSVVAGVFAGGDCVDTGEDLTVQAVDDGAKAAIAITNYLAHA